MLSGAWTIPLGVTPAESNDLNGGEGERKRPEGCIFGKENI